MLRARALLLIALGFTPPALAECSCLWGGPFARVQANTDLVATVEVLSGKGNSVDLMIEDTLRGREDRDIIRVWMHTGDLCRPEAKLFEPGSHWVMALNEIREVPADGFNPNTPNISFGRVEDYSLSSCGGYWLSLAENLVSGNLTSGPRWDMNPKMSPVLLQLVTEFVRGELGLDALAEAGKMDPELQRLRIETRSFLRGQGEDFSGFNVDDGETTE